MIFKYTAQDRHGKLFNDSMTANSVAAVINNLKLRDLLPLEIEEIKDSGARIKDVFTKVRGKVRPREVAVFTRQLSATLLAGLTLTEALEAVSDESNNAYFQEIIKTIRQDIMGGANFSYALARYPKIFSVSYVSIVRSGEATGNMGSTLESYAK